MWAQRGCTALLLQKDTALELWPKSWLHLSSWGLQASLL